MSSRELAQSYKVPFRECQNCVIDHNLVSIYVSLEWPDNAGDDGNIVINVIDKKTSTKSQKNETSASFFQQSQPLSSLLVNSVQRQLENSALTCQQQYYHPHYHSPVINNNHPTNSTTTIAAGDHNDVSSTTTTVVFNALPPQSQPSTCHTTFQQLRDDLNPQLSPVMRRQPTFLSSQHVIQTPPTNMNDSRLNIPMSTISPTSSTNQTTRVFDFSQPPTTSYLPPTPVISPPRFVVCRCLQPHTTHEYNCPLVNLNKQGSNPILSRKTTYHPLSDRDLAQPPDFASLTRPSGPILQSPSKGQGPTLFSFPNLDLMNTPGSSSSVATIISQESQLMNNNQIGPIIKLPRPETDHSFQQQPALNSSQVISNNQPNYQINSMIKKPKIRQRSTNSVNPRQGGKSPVKQKSITIPSNATHQDQSYAQQQQEVYVVNSSDSSTQQQNNSSTRISTSPITLQQGMLIFEDESRMETNVSSDNTKPGSVNGVKGSSVQQQSPSMNRNVRSPVELALAVKTTDGSTELEQIIDNVVKGEGEISMNNSTTSSNPQQQSSSSSAQPVWESNGPITTKTYFSPLQQQQQQLSAYGPNISTFPDRDVVHIAQRIVSSNIPVQNKTNTLAQQQATTNNNNKRNRPSSTRKPAPKRIHHYRPTINMPQSAMTSSSQQDILGTTVISSNSINQPVSWSDTAASSQCVITTATMIGTSMENANQHLTSFNKTDLWETSDVNNVTILDSLALITTGELDEELYLNSHYTPDFSDILLPKLNDRFNSSTPPPILPISTATNCNIFTSTSTEKFSSASTTTPLTNCNDICDKFFSPPPLTWQENQVTSSVTTPPDPRNQLPNQQQQYCSPTNEHLDPFLTPQTPTPQISGTNFNQMNNDDIQTLPSSSDQQPSEKLNDQSKPTKKHPSKTLKQQIRSNPIQRQTSAKPTCTRCGLTRLVDITYNEFPKQKGLVFECLSCGNNSIRSNVSDNERRRRLAKVAADHLTIVECQFCGQRFNAHNDYLMHLRNDHSSNKPL